uniref:ENTH domain-containing protein n=1 Tax=Candidozyma auris TaxID=498019 RepID=A0A0L0NXF0_CANAR
MNLSEMEAKVREATNNEPWGASTTLMAQIAAGTYNYREREEILSFIFRRFTEKAANEWRQIYKALQLLDYLIKNGSERIVDDVRANLSLIQMLKSFHYIDSKGRDQGINVRNRSKNLVAFLNDDALIRAERKKARANQKKFGGVSSAAFGGASSITPGFGADDDDFTNRVYGDGGVFGARYDDPADEYRNGHSGNDNYEEYDVDASAGASSSATPGHSKSTTGSSKVNATSSRSLKPAAPAPEPDLLGDLLDDPPQTQGTSSAGATNAAADDDDDDFDDFQAAPSLNNTGGASNLSSNLASLYISQPAAALRLPSQTYTQLQQQPAYTPASTSSFGGSVLTGPAKPAASNDAFSSLFTTAKTKTSQKPSSSVSTPKSVSAQPNSSGLNDFSGSSSTQASKPANANASANNGNSGEIDLLSF